MTVEVKELFGRKRFIDCDTNNLVGGLAKELELFSKNHKIRNKRILLLGCGGGREPKYFLNKKGLVTGVDFIKENISSCKKQLEGDYYCMDVCDFAKEYNHLRFDYILGFFHFFSYIKKEQRKELVKDLYNMLNTKGSLILELAFIDWKSFIRTFLSYHRGWEYGDQRFRNSINHHFSKGQIEEIFKGFEYKIENKMLILNK